MSSHRARNKAIVIDQRGVFEEMINVDIATRKSAPRASLRETPKLNSCGIDLFSMGRYLVRIEDTRHRRAQAQRPVVRRSSCTSLSQIRGLLSNQNASTKHLEKTTYQTFPKLPSFAPYKGLCPTLKESSMLLLGSGIPKFRAKPSARRENPPLALNLGIPEPKLKELLKK
jgi:hypothetical protein